MKIIALSCSPSRKRNSDTMLDHFIAGMREVPTIEVEKIYLDDIPIDFYNYENSKGALEHEIEFGKLTQKIAEGTDGLVIATPTYNFAVPAHLKNFIDRIRFIALDLSQRNALGQPVGKLAHLKTYFLVSGGTPKWAETILFFAFPAFWLRAVFLYFKARVMGAFYSGDIRTFENAKILAKCKRLGRRYASQVAGCRRQGILEYIFWRPPEAE